MTTQVGRRPRICMVGSANTDIVARVSRYPTVGSCLTGSAFGIFFGGKGSNQAVTAARLGAEVSVIVRLGDDAFGHDYLANYAQEGIDTTHVVVDPDRHSGVAMIIVEERTGLNTIAYSPNSNGALSPEDVRAGATAILAADVVMIQLEVPVDATLEACRIARGAAGRRPCIVLNAAPIPLVRPPDELLASVDVLVVNEEEATYLANCPVETVEQAFEAAAVLAGRSAAVVLTLGARGAVVMEVGGTPRYLPAREVQAVDTTGAGDAFVGSIVYLLASGASLADATPKALEIATRTVLVAGAQLSVPRRYEVADVLEGL